MTEKEPKRWSPAAEWAYVVIYTPSPNRLREFGRWLKHPEHYQAFIAECVEHHPEPTKLLHAMSVALASVSSQLAIEENEHATGLNVRKHAQTWCAIALGAFLTLLPWPFFIDLGGWTNHRTGVGGYQRIVLPDGSVAELNTSTAMSYRFSEGKREVLLEGGEANFRVAHDSQRPFIVAARDTFFEAVGTAFSVRIDDTQTQVHVSNGVVAMEHRVTPSRMSLWFDRLESPSPSAPRVSAGATGTDSHGRITVDLKPSKLANPIEWRNEVVTFGETSVGEIAKELNRYNSTRLVPDKELSRTHLGGQFRTRDVDGFIVRLEDVLGKRLVRKPGPHGETVISMSDAPPAESGK